MSFTNIISFCRLALTPIKAKTLKSAKILPSFIGACLDLNQTGRNPPAAVRPIQDESRRSLPSLLHLPLSSLGRVAVCARHKAALAEKDCTARESSLSLPS